MVILPEWESKMRHHLNWPPERKLRIASVTNTLSLCSSLSRTAALTRLGASSLCVDHLEPFANNWHGLVKGSILEVITAKVVFVSHSPIGQRSVSFTFFKGELLRNFVRGKNDNTKGFDNEQRVTVPIQDDRKIPFFWERRFIVFVAHQCRARCGFYALSHECGQLIGQLF